MRKGSKGNNVKKLQTDLMKLGFGQFLGNSKNDGNYGKMTESAVAKFQAWSGIKVDKIAGRITQNTVKKSLNNAGKKGTYNFNINEFKCKGTGKMLSKGMDKNLMHKLELLRLDCGNRGVVINSGYRTKKHNKNVGGASNSQHIYGKAADIVVRGVSAGTVYNKATSVFYNGGVGKYPTFTHVDTRGYKARF